MPPFDRRRALLVVVLVALLAVVAALAVSGAPQTTGLLDVDPAEGSVDGRVVAFEELSTGEQEQFRRALRANGSIEVPLADAEEWLGTEAVRYDGRTYEVFVAVP
jgi:uncharacterized membrane protein